MIHQLANEANAPPEFLQAILLELKNAGILGSRRGIRGGYRLLKPPNEVTVGAIVRILDGPLVTLPCAADSNGHRCEDCWDCDTCRTRDTMQAVRQAITAILDGATFEAG
jgi:Rrf2 family protein